MVSIIIVINIVVFIFVIVLAFSKHYRKVGQSFCGLARSFELDERPGLSLNSCMPARRKRICLHMLILV